MEEQKTLVVETTNLKKEARIIGIDDGHHARETSEPVLVVGAVLRGKSYLDNVLATTITADGIDATPNLIKMVNTSRAKGNLSAIMLDGVTLGGFNVVNIKSLSENTNLPVIVAVRKEPDYEAIQAALKNIEDGEQKFKLIELAGDICELEIKNKQTEGKMYFQFAGCTLPEAEDFLKLAIIHSLIPEPVRTAHLIAQGITLGESKGRV